ncbi:hypothetical protein EP30_09865 [Bifidobacterium sp. UTCIF-39]|uniref:substrate-binding domain-containing protein n=1 Tax=Bifidobacterium sp. UTCIF-39 TaxID=1465359 RepID=UPI0015E4219D|nr:substrate-binding domain-containing protein [Bifidobacterium sp. UTCIF-39]TPF96017.1 hypothetical protein EP30_09865 [Bifidobacterium sp. UTCIF-39]
MKLGKSKIIGLAALLVVVLVICGAVAFRGWQQKNAPQPVKTETVTGYLGGEKISLFEDQKFTELAKKNGLDVDYRKAGSLDMMTADRNGMSYLFPSSKVAVEYGKAQNIDTSSADIVFNSPIVIYTHKQVADALVGSGMMSQENGVYHIDMAKAVDAMKNNKTWADVGWNGGYGSFRIDSTDPVKSNSGNEYAALVATVLNGGQPATTDSVQRDSATLQTIFGKSGWMDSSSEDSFNQFLTLGVGSKPMMIGYENQVLDLAVNQPDAWKQVKDDIVIVYPTPTVWSTHMLIPLDDKGRKLLTLLKSDDVQKLAWQQHGFRSANFSGTDGIKRFGVPGTVDQVTSVTELPSSDAMQAIIGILQKQQG